MTRDGRGIERLDLTTYEALIGGLGNTPEDVGINIKTFYFAPRLGAMYRFGEKAVVRAGYGRTINPLPWSRPMRGSFPYDIFYNRTAEQFTASGHARAGHPAGAGARPQHGPGAAAARRLHALAEPERRRSRHHPAVERGLRAPPAGRHRGGGGLRRDARTDGGYADLNLNYGEPGGGNAARQYFALAGTTAVRDWAARTKSRYHGLQLALNRPLRNGLLLKGAYTYSDRKNMTRRRGRLDRTSPGTPR